MKKILLTIFMVFGFLSNAQEFKLEGKTLTGIFEVEGKSKSELFSSINKWISINYNSSKNVIQMNDLESGTIIVKGINEVRTKNAFKKLYPNSAPEFNYYKFNHLIEINIKDNRYRIIYRTIDIASVISPNDHFNNDCVNFNGVEQNVIESYNEKMEGLLKMGFVGKKKRDDFKSETKAYLDGVNNNIIDNEKLTMLSIEKSVNSVGKDNW
jgi:hypothetical protein